MNSAFQDLLGYRKEQLLGRPYLSFVHPDDVEETVAMAASLAEGQVNQGGFENRYQAADGSYRWLRWTSTTDHSRGLVYATARDVTETKNLEKRLTNLAHTDSLTGLLNRRHFEDESRRQLEFIARYGPGAALFLFDIDRFKTINDTEGHAAGDAALKKVADAMDARVRKTDICARVGGDEFAILFPGVDRAQAASLAESLLDSIRSSSDGGPTTTSSIGIALFDPTEPVPLETLMGEADEAMYQAKRAGGNRYAFAAIRLQENEPAIRS